MVQLKYQTPGATRPRLAISAASYSFVNGLSGSDMVLDFESLSLVFLGEESSCKPPNYNFRKSGTLHIPVPESIYTILTENGKGTYTNRLLISELEIIRNTQIAKLVRIIKRYEFSLKWLEDAKVTTLPLTIYRSADVVNLSDKLVMLVGDASSGLVFQRFLVDTYICNYIHKMVIK